jgi:hypothetical protein
MCACGKTKKIDAITSVQAAEAMVAGGDVIPPDEIRKINKVREQRSINNAAANAGS